MADCCCTPPPLDLDTHKRNVAKYRRVLWAVLAINAAMFVIEVGAGLAAGSASLQADALDSWATRRTTASVFSLLAWPCGTEHRLRWLRVRWESLICGVVGTAAWHACRRHATQRLHDGGRLSTLLTSSPRSWKSSREPCRRQRGLAFSGIP